MSIPHFWEQWFVLHIQPEPWRIPPMSPGRKGGKLYVATGADEQLATYQAAVRDLMEPIVHDLALVPTDVGRLQLTIFYWRQITKGVHEADATNLNKALEDALQGVLYDNDRRVGRITGDIVQQDENVTEPRIAILAREYTPVWQYAIPEHVKEILDRGPAPAESDMTWPPK